jgi:RNA polymerase II subunit A-like phosphatase
MVCIIDDREDVWKFSPSLVHVKPYLFFDGTADINAPHGLEGETWEGENVDDKVEKSEEKKKHRSRVVKVPKNKSAKKEAAENNQVEKRRIVKRIKKKPRKL